MKQDLRILHLYHDFWPARGGIEDYLADLVRAQAAAGADVTVLCASQDWRTRLEWMAGVRVVRAGVFGRYYTPFCPSWPQWMSRLHPDLVHLHLPGPLGEWAVMLARPAALVVSLHNDYVRPAWAVRLHGSMHRALLRRAPAIIVGAPDYARTSPNLLALQSRVRIVPYGITTGQYGPGAAPRSGVLFAGRLCYYKGVEVLLRGAADLRAPVTIVGDGPWRRKLEALAAQRGGRVRFEGVLSEPELIRRLQTNRVFAFPSTGRGEAFGIVQLKAMACGLPVVSSDLAGVSWLNRHGETGLVVPAGDATALTAALNRILDDGALWRRLSAGAMVRAREFDAQRTAAATQQVYAEVLQASESAVIPG